MAGPCASDGRRPSRPAFREVPRLTQARGVLLVAVSLPCATCGNEREHASPERGSVSTAAVPAASPAAPSTARAGADTARGTITVVGVQPATDVVLQPAAGGPSLILSTDEQESLNRVSGLDVWVEGTRVGSTHFVVSRFAVRSADGIAAADGVLTGEDGRVLLVTADGRRLPLAQPTAALRNQIGARVWISGPLDRAPVSFGIITPGRI